MMQKRKLKGRFDGVFFTVKLTEVEELLGKTGKLQT